MGHFSPRFESKRSNALFSASILRDFPGILQDNETLWANKIILYLVFD